MESAFSRKLKISQNMSFRIPHKPTELKSQRDFTTFFNALFIYLFLVFVFVIMFSICLPQTSPTAVVLLASKLVASC